MYSSVVYGRGASGLSDCSHRGNMVGAARVLDGLNFQLSTLFQS